MPAPLFEIEPLLSALADDAPCGPELDADADWQALERAGVAIATLEGCLIQARVEQSPAPILAAGRLLGLLLQRA